jgi:Fe-S protein assembly co-chaperone HscB
MKNYFEIFSLKPSFQINTDQLQKNFLILQARCHPDQFNQSSQSQQKNLAIQMSATLNQAKSTLENPAKRAAYCTQLCGVDLNQSKAELAIIQQQFIWQEQLFEARDQYLETITNAWQDLLHNLAHEFNILFEHTYHLQKTAANSGESVINPSELPSSEFVNISENLFKLGQKAQNIILLFNFSKNFT